MDGVERIHTRAERRVGEVFLFLEILETFGQQMGRRDETFHVVFPLPKPLVLLLLRRQAEWI